MGFHLFPFRTEKLSPFTPMVLHLVVGEQVAASSSADSQSALFLCFALWQRIAVSTALFCVYSFSAVGLFFSRSAIRNAPLTGAHFSLRYWCWFGHSIADAVPEESIPNREDKFIHSASKTRHTLFVFFRPHRSEAIYYPEKAVLFFRKLMLVRTFDC